MTRIQKTEQMFALIQSYQSSDLTQRDFCLENDINYSTFQFWLKRYRQDNNSQSRDERLASGGFVPITVSPSTVQHDFCLQIEYPSGIRVSFGSVPEMGFIRELLALEVV